MGAAIGHGGEFDQPSSKTLQAGLSSLSSLDRPSHPEVRLYPSSFAGHSPTCSQHHTATPSGFGGSQVETGDNG
jgi:hypothetical protein